MKNLLHSFILFILAFVFLPAAFAQNSQIYIESGVDAYFDGKYEEALRHFNRVERIDPDYPDLYAYRGNTYYMLGEYRNAELDYQLALDKLPRPGRNTTLTKEEADELNQRYSIAYNNLGVVHFLLGERQKADEDFKIAMEFDPDFRLAYMNARSAVSGRGASLDIQHLGVSDSDFSHVKERDGTYTRIRNTDRNVRENRAERPNLGYTPQNPRKQRNETEDMREQRQQDWENTLSDSNNDNFIDNFIDNLLKSKPFIKRSVSRRGKIYRTPDYKLGTQAYVSIELVKIIDRSTFVTIKVQNPDRYSYDVNIADKDDPEAYRIIARTTTGHKEYPLKRIANIQENPRTTELRSGVPLYFTLEFDRIADNIGYINIVEGNKQSETAWNFYEVDLAK